METTKFVQFKGEELRSAIDKMGLTMNKVSTMILGLDQSYVSKACKQGSMNDIYLRKLCEFFSLDYDSIIIKPEPPKLGLEPVMPQNPTTAPLETLIVGLNTVYEQHKETNEILKELLVEIKALNVKQNRLENALGQIVSNSIAMKEHIVEMKEQHNYLKSQANITNGRLKDLVNVFPKK